MWAGALQIVGRCWRGTTRFVAGRFRGHNGSGSRPPAPAGASAGPWTPPPPQRAGPAHVLRSIPVACTIAPAQAPCVPAGSDNPRLTALRRAAAFDLFRHCGLGAPPRSLWRFVDGHNDVGRGVERLLSAIGASPSEARSALGALLRTEGRLIRLPSPRADDLRQQLFSGDPERVIAAMRAAKAEQTPAGHPWPTEVLSPGLLSDRQAGPLVEAAVIAVEEHETLRGSIVRHWPDAWLSGDASNRLRNVLAGFDEAEVRFLASLHVNGETACSHLAAMNRFNRDLAELDRSARFESASDAPADQANQVSEAELLIQFSATLGAASSREAVDAAWSAFRFHHHPDRPHLDPGARARAERLSAGADRALDRVESLSAFAGAPAQA